MSDRPVFDLDTAERVLLCPTCKTANAIGTNRCDSCIRDLSDLSPVPAQVGRDAIVVRKKRRQRRFRMRLGAIALVIVGLGLWQTAEYYGFVRFMSAPQSLVSAAPATAASTDWPMFQRDPMHGGNHSEGGVMPAGDVLWSFEMGTKVPNPPAVVDGTVYLAAGLRGVVALDAETGDLLWQYGVAGTIETAVAVAGDRVFAGLRDGRVVALDRHTGEQQWSVQTGNKIFSSPAVLNGIVYIGSGDNFLYVIDAETGGIRWKYHAGDSIIASPAVSEDVIAFTAHDRKLYVVETHSGKLRFDYRLDFVGGSPSILGDRVYIGDEAGILRSIDWHQRTLPLEKALVKLKFYGWWYGITSELQNQKGFVWGFSPPGSSPMGTAVPTDELVYVPATAGRLYAVDTLTGDEVWSFRTAGQLLGSPAVVGGTVVLGDEQGRLYGLNGATGEPLWEIRGLGGSVVSTPVVAGDTIYVSTQEGRLLAIR
jgi:eukaryotic-like serine/threonine-protein kinase